MLGVGIHRTKDPLTPPNHAASLETLLCHRAWVRAVARALVRGDHDADDLEQETWLAAAKAPPPEDRAPRAWLGTVLRRTAAKLRLRNTRRELRERAAAPREAASEADLVAEAEMHERVVRTVLALPEPYRATVLWRYFEDLEPAEIAARTSTPVGTVRARLSRALALLRSELRDRNAGAWPLALVALAGSHA
jgi:RNA polymerase sigma factor (sigma-70 family)